MIHRAVLALCLVCATALTAASTAHAEEVMLTSAPTSTGASHYHLDRILGLDPVELTMPASRLDSFHRPAPRNIVSSEERTVIIVAAAIVGVVLVVAVIGRH